MKQSLQLNLTQQLKLTPHLQQAIRLLQLSTLDLRQEIQQQLESNPMLEAAQIEEQEELDNKDDPEEASEDFQWEQLYSSSTPDQAYNEYDYIYTTLHCTTTNLKDHLSWQAHLTPLTEVDKLIATAIIESLNEDGFLTVSLAEIKESLDAVADTIAIEEILAVQHLIQHFDPLGCACSSLAEALSVQLLEYKEKGLVIVCKKIINNNLEVLAQQNYSKLKSLYKLTDNQLENVIQIIYQLNPKPGRLVSSPEVEFNIPDLTVQKIESKWHVFLNQSALPQVGINKFYASLAHKISNPTDVKYFKNNLQDAKWFVKSIQSRQETLLRVAQYLVSYQSTFLEQGVQAMRPLTLKQVADALDIHESTVSRVTTQKFISTPRGLFELKYFFSSQLPSNSVEASSTAIKELIKQLISKEDTRKPLSDLKLVKAIAAKGVQIARRTVTKYREEMGLGASPQRKKFAVKR
jgi:RNA polymerase sigma-54 factor